MQAFDAVHAQFQQQQGAEPGAAAQELQAVHQQAQAAVGAAAAALQQNFQALQEEFAAAAQQTAATVMEPHLHFIGRLQGLGECRAAHCCAVAASCLVL
jgi:diadenosine tetraphosphate (Ap4A) HIT family hydrolase